MIKEAIYKYMYDANSDKLKFLEKMNNKYKFHNLTDNTIELLPREALQGLVEIKPHYFSTQSCKETAKLKNTIEVTD